ncbi:HNH endonuclease signature motif containing protein [uncultured Nocardioides sp.]|uniref:HNH endonuclease signature motif containing protein n=1 Tax=uncultured Nocardioides sp. TaxID=198441 RepID=UPI002636164A|nr:HNH endonuclease signature motif containing protein [uncultured Nocardioides sp.]
MVTEAAREAGWEQGSHPLLSAVATIEAALDTASAALAAGTDPGWLDATDQGLLLVGLAQCESRLAALKLSTLTAVDGPDGVASITGARTPADWLAARLHLNSRRVGGEARLAARVARRRVLATAMLDGRASLDHARAVVDCLDALPPDLVDETTMAAAEEMLVGYCTEFTPAEVTHLGRRILETVAPEVADRIEAERLARAEREAWRRTKLSTKPIGEGLIRVTADIPALHASILDMLLDTIANPSRPDNQGANQRADQGANQKADDGQHLTGPERRGQAFCTLLENLDTTDLPHRHGSAVSVAVLIDEDKLRADLEQAGFAAPVSTTTGVDITYEQARRLLCNARVYPYVLSGKSVILDAGRTRRLIEGALRRAAEVAHHHCQARGCTVPAAWCDGHHLEQWAKGGTTRLEDVALLCPHHHRRVHDPRYETRWADGEATFHLRP